MSCSDFDFYKKKFLEYAQRYIGFSQEQDTNILLKQEHSLKVLEEARRIADTLPLPKNLVRVIELAALFHDAGRFVQFEKYRTFNDRTSANHARLSVEVLHEEGFLSDCSTDDYKVIVGAVLLHNRRFLSSKLRPDVDLVAKIIRDADKLDIMRVVLSQFEKPSNNAVTLGLKEDLFAYNPSILKDVQSRRTAVYEQMIWVNDFKLLIASWTYGMNFRVSRKAILSRGYIERLFKCLPQEGEFAALKQQLIKDLARNESINE